MHQTIQSYVSTNLPFAILAKQKFFSPSPFSRLSEGKNSPQGKRKRDKNKEGRGIHKANRDKNIRKLRWNGKWCAVEKQQLRLHFCLSRLWRRSKTHPSAEKFSFNSILTKNCLITIVCLLLFCILPMNKSTLRHLWTIIIYFFFFLLIEKWWSRKSHLEPQKYWITPLSGSFRSTCSENH